MIESRNQMRWLGALTMALVLGASHLLDSPVEVRARWAPSEAPKELHATEAGAERREAGEPAGTTWLTTASR